jgi:hypothetical protein
MICQGVPVGFGNQGYDAAWGGGGAAVIFAVVWVRIVGVT